MGLVDQRIEQWEGLLSHSQPVIEVNRCAEEVLDDPAEEAAPLARYLAKHHCRTDAESGTSCAWYHGNLLYKSLMIQDTPRSAGRCSLGWQPSHAKFYLDTIQPLARTGNFSRFMISGSSDYMMPSVIFGAYRREHAPVKITLVDVCETPLQLSKWYAARVGASIDTVRSDIFDYHPDRPFDVLSTHHFLSFIEPGRRPALFRKWRRTLRRGGKLVIVNSVRPSNHCEKIAEFSEADEDRLRATIEAAEMRLNISFPPHDEFVGGLLNHNRHWQFYSVQSSDEVAGLLTEAGFVVERLVTLDSDRSVLPGARRLTEKKETFGLVATAV